MIDDKYINLYNDLYNSGYHDDDTCHTRWLIENYVKTYIKPGNAVIDVGCSTGNALELLTKYDYKVTGVDISQVAVERCRERGFPAIVGDTTSISVESNSFLGLTCTDVLEHVPENLISRSIVEFCRVVHHDGLMFLQIAKMPENNRRFNDITENHGFKNLHVTCWPTDKWLEEFSKWNLHVRHMEDQPRMLRVVLQNKITPEKLCYFNNRL